MTEQQVKQLLSRYHSGKAKAEEVKLLENWYLAVSREQKLDAREADFGGLKKEIWMGTLKRAGLEDVPAETPAQELQPRTGTASGQSVPHLLRGKAGTWRLWLASAAAVAAITIGVWLYRPLVILNLFQDPNAIAKKNDIAPGKNTATLTLANGTTINLDTNRTSVVVTDSVKTTTTLTASTPRGGQYQVVLPDGTRVWLNADSKLTFPSNFENKKQRIVKLEGEAYFAVVHNANHPFKVESKGQVVEDIGTEFNISAYGDDASIKTTLVEGLAKVNEVDLVPNQQAIVSNSKINVIPIDAAEATAWKRGEFLFNKQPLGSIMKQIARWYDVEIRYEDDKIERKPFWGSITRFTNVSDVLRMLELTGDVHFKIDGRTIIVKP